MRRMRLLAAGVFLGLLALGPARVDAQASFGAEAMFGSETDFGIGGRVQLPLGTTLPLEFQGSFDLFFPDGPVDYWEINANIWYLIETRGSTVAVPYVGGGLNIGHSSTTGFSDTEAGINLGGGARFEFENTTPFVEARFVIGGVGQFVIGGGFLFGGF